MEPLYVARPGGMRLFGGILTGLLVIDLVTSLALLLFVDAVSAGISFVAMFLTFGLVWAVLPRRYEVWPDHLRIAFPLFGWDLDYAGIESVRAGRWYEAYGFMGWRFATAPSQTVTILRHNANMLSHPNVVISPEDRETFLRELQRAMRR